MKTKLIILAACAVTASPLFATVSLSFNLAFDGNVSSNLANKSGVVTNGMLYGVIIDTTGNGILSEYGGITAAQNSRIILSASSVPTDDILIFASDVTASTSFLSDINGNPGGNGGVFGVNSIALTGGVTAGDKFYLVWFDNTLPTPNIQAGSLTDASYTIPADGSTLDYDQAWGSPNTLVRRADKSYVGTGAATPLSTGIAFVPEPSAALLGAVGALGLLRRRRN